MPTYVYGCPEDRDHPQQEIVHGMNANPTVKCAECGAVMHRVPQPFRWSMNAGELLTEWMDDNYRRKRAGKPLHSPDLVKRPYKPIPQVNYQEPKKKRKLHG